MSGQTVIQNLQRQINDIRIENHEGRKFVPEKVYFDLLKRDAVTAIVCSDSPIYYIDEIVDFVMKSARKVFGILVLLHLDIRCLDQFIRNDQYRNRELDDLLPFSTDTLKATLEDPRIVADFFEKQWEFCAPVFSGRIMPRELELRTILPYLEETAMESGSFGTVTRVKLHPSHQPDSTSTHATFVRKEFRADDHTYRNEVRILSTLQLLENPNILQLTSCYTYRWKHNLLTPYVSGGTLRKFLSRPKPAGYSHARLTYALSGLACGLWALHELALDNNVQSHKGHHQDLGVDNVLVEGDRFILADFGLSNIRSITEASQTPFKGRRGYCQAPECADLGRPYQEHDTTRATDIFALGCIAADALVHLVRGPTGLEDFRNAREFQLPPMCYYLYHKGDAANVAVITYLNNVAQENGNQSVVDLVQLIAEMLKIAPEERPSASAIMAKLCLLTIQAYSEQFSTLFSRFASSADANIEEARFLSWQQAQDAELYSESQGATRTGKSFDSTMKILQQFKESLENIRTEAINSRTQPFLELSILNTQLLHTLSPERRVTASSWYDSVILARLSPQPHKRKHPGDSSSDIQPGPADSRTSRLSQIKQIVAQMHEDTSLPSDILSGFTCDSNTVTHTGISIGRYTSGALAGSNPNQSRPVLIETIQYHDSLGRGKLLKRINGLCQLLLDRQLGSQFGILHLAGVVERKATFTLELLYHYPKLHLQNLPPVRPMTLHDLLDPRHNAVRLPWESRMRLGLELAESLAAFHDVNWYHKDLTSFNILFFLEVKTTGGTCIHRPYLVGFQHSHSASDDVTEGPVQDRKHQRYHHPQYLDVKNGQFKRFRPCYDRYSLGILLIEIGFWSNIDKVMASSGSAKADNQTFSTILQQQKVPELAFFMGSDYAQVVRECLTDLHCDGGTVGRGTSSQSTTNILFKQRVIAPLKEHCRKHVTETGKKRNTEEVP